ncbi:cdc-25.3, partial [Pristionchus pacificus]|uniref:protein-tyrosine-phosphatase n=1 Tax=Pristionchus pacificus TaxID=54126 RepID=A0A2A6CR38_PRIPA
KPSPLPLPSPDRKSAVRSCSEESGERRKEDDECNKKRQFYAPHEGFVVVKLSREMASMHIDRIREKEERTKMDLMDIFNEDENARDCDSSFSMMPPPALPTTRRVLGDIKNSRINSPVSSKSFARNDTMPTMSAHLTGGLRNRKRMNDSCVAESPFGARMGGGKRWRIAESIDEHSETASTSYAPREHSVDCQGGEEKGALMTSSSTSARHSFHRVQSTSVLEMGIYSHQHNEDNLPAPLEVNYALARDPALDKADSDVYRRIGAGQLSELMRTMGADFAKSYVLIDCRYPYEFDGGHIKGATNVYDPLAIDAHFFSSSTSLLRKEEGEEGRRIPIFYCEFSQKRGPSMALAVRAFDRLRNCWPVVDHAEMYVLNGGYKGFHKNAEDNGLGELCDPFSYIQMEDPKYKAQMDKFRQHKSRNLLSYQSTVSRLPMSTMEARRLAQSQQASPIGVTRRASRRALCFDSSSSPLRPSSLISRLPNPQFS